MVIGCGCSFVWGTELPDTENDTKYSLSTWPALTAKRLRMPYRCEARGGAGNLYLLDRISKHTQHAEPKFFLISWTFIDRFDYVDIHGHEKTPGHWMTLRPNVQDADYYYKNLHSEYRDKLTNLCYIKTAVDLMESKRFPYLMTYMDSLLFDSRWHSSPGIRGLQEYLKPKMTMFGDMNFLKWSDSNGYASGPYGHPLEQAHKSAADFLAPTIDAILNKA